MTTKTVAAEESNSPATLEITKALTRKWEVALELGNQACAELDRRTVECDLLRVQRDELRSVLAALLAALPGSGLLTEAQVVARARAEVAIAAVAGE